MRLCRTRTGDFSTRELLDTKDRYGQLYVDVSRKLFPDDFARDLRKLAESKECADCERREHCGGAWAALRANSFEADERLLLERLGRLRGRVLDIGCGDAPYLGVLRDAAHAGEVEYLGIDPDAQRIEVLRSRHGAWARYAVGTLETSLQPELSFDHALVLRSYNHLPDPARVVQLAAARLRAGGTLTVVDNVVYGLVRPREVARAAEAGPAEHEHYRNHSAEQARTLIDGVCSASRLRLLECLEVSPSTSNQWLLRYEKEEETS